MYGLFLITFVCKVKNCNSNKTWTIWSTAFLLMASAFRIWILGYGTIISFENSLSLLTCFIQWAYALALLILSPAYSALEMNIAETLCFLVCPLMMETHGSVRGILHECDLALNNICMFYWLDTLNIEHHMIMTGYSLSKLSFALFPAWAWIMFSKFCAIKDLGCSYEVISFTISFFCAAVNGISLSVWFKSNSIFAFHLVSSYSWKKCSWERSAIRENIYTCIYCKLQPWGLKGVVLSS